MRVPDAQEPDLPDALKEIGRTQGKASPGRRASMGVLPKQAKTHPSWALRALAQCGGSVRWVCTIQARGMSGVSLLRCRPNGDSGSPRGGRLLSCAATLTLSDSLQSVGQT